MSKIAVGIVTTKSRENVLLKTLNSLGFDTDIEIFCDLEKGLYKNHRAAWNELFKIADTALLLQDDLSASKNWYKTAQLFEDKFPQQQVFNFFDMYGGRKRERIGDRNYILENGLWEQAVMMRKQFHEVLEQNITQEILDKYENKKRPGDYHHDAVINDVMNKLKVKQMKVFPPFFQHRDEESSVGNNRTYKGKPRQCEWYLGDETDAYEYFKERLC